MVRLTDRQGGPNGRVLDDFRGLRRADRIAEGEFYDMQNLSGISYPLLRTRPHRRTVRPMRAPGGMINVGGVLAYVEGSDLYYNGTAYELELTPEGMDDSGVLGRQLILMGAYLVIWPDRKYFNTVTLEHGSMDAETQAANLTVTLCRSGGDAYTIPAGNIGPTAPANPSGGDLWLDTAGHALKEWDSGAGMWSTVPTTYLKIAGGAFGAFSKGDGVDVSGFTGDLAALNGTHVLRGAGEQYVIITGLMDAATATATDTVTFSRTAPDMDYLIESGNRLWGCKYGRVDGQVINEIYASKLGDFRNWRCYEGLATDSYAASRGSAGDWTGAVNYGGHPMFFKEDVLEKVYPSSTGAHQIVTVKMPGVQKGSWRSLAEVDGALYYLSPGGVYRYSGSFPVKVSDALGGVDSEDQFADENGVSSGVVGAHLYSGAGAGVGGRYYLHTQVMGHIDDGDMQPVIHRSLYVYDTNLRMWHKEDDVGIYCMESVNEDVYAMTFVPGESDRALVHINYGGAVKGDTIPWMAETGYLDLQHAENKYYSRLVIRMDLDGELTAYVQVNGGPWENKGTVLHRGKRSFEIPVRPERGDFVRLRLTGLGDCRIYSIEKYYEAGSDSYGAH